MEIIGWILAVLIGITLGLLGGGGSILTVPVLVYILDINAVTATGYSLFIVGFSAIFGAASYYRKNLIDVKTAVIFGIPAIAGVYVSRMYLVPAIPEELLPIGDFIVTKSIAIMVLFGAMMIAASVSMIKGRKDIKLELENRKFNYPLILVEGFAVGILTGLIGAGGGFLIIPALVILSDLPMKMAVGTSLAIISVKSLIGFTGDVMNHSIDWTFLLTFTALAVLGIFLGTKLSNVISGQKLKPIFGWFVLLMGVYILGREVIF